MDSSKTKNQTNIIVDKIYDCKWNGNKCTLDMKRTLYTAEKQLPIGYFVDINGLKTDMVDFIPTNMKYGYYGADGNYYSTK